MVLALRAAQADLARCRANRGDEKRRKGRVSGIEILLPDEERDKKGQIVYRVEGRVVDDLIYLKQHKGHEGDKQKINSRNLTSWIDTHPDSPTVLVTAIVEPKLEHLLAAERKGYIRIPTSKGDILLEKRHQSKMFNKSILATEDKNFAVGYDIIDQQLIITASDRTVHKVFPEGIATIWDLAIQSEKYGKFAKEVLFKIHEARTIFESDPTYTQMAEGSASFPHTSAVKDLLVSFFEQKYPDYIPCHPDKQEEVKTFIGQYSLKAEPKPMCAGFMQMFAKSKLSISNRVLALSEMLVSCPTYVENSIFDDPTHKKVMERWHFYKPRIEVLIRKVLGKDASVLLKTTPVNSKATVHVSGHLYINVRLLDHSSLHRLIAKSFCVNGVDCFCYVLELITNRMRKDKDINSILLAYIQSFSPQVLVDDPVIVGTHMDGGKIAIIPQIKLLNEFSTQIKTPQTVTPIILSNPDLGAHCVLKSFTEVKINKSLLLTTKEPDLVPVPKTAEKTNQTCDFVFPIELPVSQETKFLFNVPRPPCNLYTLDKPDNNSDVKISISNNAGMDVKCVLKMDKNTGNLFAEVTRVHASPRKTSLTISYTLRFPKFNICNQTTPDAKEIETGPPDKDCVALLAKYCTTIHSSLPDVQKTLYSAFQTIKSLKSRDLVKKPEPKANVLLDQIRNGVGTCTTAAYLLFVVCKSLGIIKVQICVSPQNYHLFCIVQNNIILDPQMNALTYKHIESSVHLNDETKMLLGNNSRVNVCNKPDADHCKGCTVGANIAAGVITEDDVLEHLVPARTVDELSALLRADKIIVKKALDSLIKQDKAKQRLDNKFGLLRDYSPTMVLSVLSTNLCRSTIQISRLSQPRRLLTLNPVETLKQKPPKMIQKRLRERAFPGSRFVVVLYFMSAECKSCEHFAANNNDNDNNREGYKGEYKGGQW